MIFQKFFGHNRVVPFPKGEKMKVTPQVSHSSILFRHLEGLKLLKFDPKIFREVMTLANPTDIAYILLPAIITKPLISFYENAHKNDAHNFKYSLVGYLQQPFLYLAKFPLWLFTLDVFSILIHSFGFDFHIKGGLPDLIAKVSYCLLAGIFITRLKDWYFQQVLRQKSNLAIRRDYVREGTIDEITSILLWALVGVIGLEFLSLKLGVALGSIFAGDSMKHVNVYFVLLNFRN